MQRIFFSALICALFLLNQAQSLRYEAEKAHRVGSDSDASIQGFVDLGEEGDKIIFTVNSEHDRVFDASIQYHSPEGTALGLKVNGHVHSHLQLPSSNSPSSHKIQLNLRKGINSIQLQRNSLSPRALVDFIEIEGTVEAASRGATVPFFELEAEDANHNGNLIGPDRVYMTLASEASGRKAVQITGNQFVEFTLTQPANAIVVRFSIPDTPTGSGQVAYLKVSSGSVSLPLQVTSKWSWAYGGYPFNKMPSAGSPHHFYDESRALFNQTLPQGAKVRIEGNTQGVVFTIDMADFYMAPAPYSRPQNFLSVTDFGADPSGNQDSTSAFQKAIDSANGKKVGVWIPKGTFTVNSRFVLDKITVRGAGPWYSNVVAAQQYGVGFFGKWAADGGSSEVELYDFAITGMTNARVDTQVDSGVGGALSKSLVQNLWIEHTKCGMWLDGPFDGFHVVGTTMRNTYADGINFHTGVTNSVVEQCSLRNLGDDGLAMWSEHTPDANNVFKFNTIQMPLLANGIAIYGGKSNAVTDNILADTVCEGGGVQIANRFGAEALSGNTNVARNTLIRCGSPNRSNTQHSGALWIWPQEKPFNGGLLVEDHQILDSSYAGITFMDGSTSNIDFKKITIKKSDWAMELHAISGSANFYDTVATEVGLGVASCVGDAFKLIDISGNSGWNTTKCMGF